MMLAAIEVAGLTLPGRYPEKWVVDCKSVGSGESALIYLARYIYRGVIAEKDSLACDTAQVSFRYRNAKTGMMERRTVSVPIFCGWCCSMCCPKGSGGVPARAQLWLSSSQLQAPDRLAAPAAEVRPRSGDGMVQGMRADPVHLLRSGDGDCENVDCLRVLRDHASATNARCHSRGALTR